MIKFVFRPLFCLIIILSGSHLSTAQNVDFKKENFLSKLSEFNQIDKVLKDANRSYNDGFFKIALQGFQQANDFNPNNAELNYKMGRCYLNSSFKNLAKAHFEKAFDLKQDVASDIYYYLGLCYHLELDWNKAEEYYNLYKSKMMASNNNEELRKVNKRLEECSFGRKIVKKPVKVKIENMGAEVNSPYIDYSPVIDADESVLIFTSRRPGTTTGSAGEKDDSIDEYWEDVYISYKLNEKWTKPRNIGPPINTTGHEASNNLSPDGEILFLYIDNKGQGDIYESKLENLAWGKPQLMKDPISTKFHETSATINSRLDTLYFVSERPGGYGGKDIYFAVKGSDGKWGNVQNIGAVINTEWDEESVYLMPDGKTLYFSSQGHNSIGGFDIFKTNLKNGNWTEPINLGYPINSADDDVNFVMAASGKRGYYSSVKYEGFGELDLYIINFLPNEDNLDNAISEDSLAMIVAGTKTATSGILRGLVTDGYNQSPIIAQIEIIDIGTNQVVETVKSNPKNGRYAVYLPSENNYKINVTSSNYNPSASNVNIPPSKGNIEVVKDFQLISLASVTTILRGTIYDATSKEPLEATVAIKDKVKDLEIAKVKTGVDGKYEIAIPSGKNYQISAKSPDHMNAYDEIDIPMAKQNQSITKDLSLYDLKVGAKIVLKNIFYDFDKATLRPASIVELERLIELLNEYPTMRIELSSHTDNKGSPEYNIVLSNNRSKAVVDYLLSKGIDKKRLEYKGYGLTQPIATNDTDEGRQLNRRTEFKILSK
jgi:outer membrane protein OmpA-like peptidoglycan-associated protein/tetratricopeptide (TPR) repeat protein